MLANNADLYCGSRSLVRSVKNSGVVGDASLELALEPPLSNVSASSTHVYIRQTKMDTSGSCSVFEIEKINIHVKVSRFRLVKLCVFIEMHFIGLAQALIPSKAPPSKKFINPSLDGAAPFSGKVRQPLMGWYRV